MDPRSLEVPTLPPPPKAVSALVYGFNAVASNVAVILFPILFDVFLWLGPRLKADALLAPIMEMLPEIQRQAPVGQAKIIVQLMTEFYNGFNLFSVLRTFPLGVFSLMSVNISVKSPLGTRPALGSSDVLITLGFILLLNILGWLVGSLYFKVVADAALKPHVGPSFARAVLHSMLLSLFWAIISVLATFPALLIMWAITLLDGVLRTVVFMLLAVPASWLLMSIFFSFHGVFVNGQNAFTATLSSMRLLRYGLPPLGWFTMLAIITSQGMDMLWHVPPEDSWMMGVGILGHAFVSTGLLAASLVYYRDLTIWIESASKWFEKQRTSRARA